jgi:hypothetical protein
MYARRASLSTGRKWRSKQVDVELMHSADGQNLNYQFYRDVDLHLRHHPGDICISLGVGPMDFVTSRSAQLLVATSYMLKAPFRLSRWIMENIFMRDGESTESYS